MIYWLIGQPGCGKTTLAKRLVKKLECRGDIAIHFDGDDLRKIFDNGYSPKTFTKKWRIEQTRILQKLVAFIADKGFDVVVSTVNPYRAVREEFKQSRFDVKEIHVHRSNLGPREDYKVKDFEEPKTNYTCIVTGGNLSEDDSFHTLCAYLWPKNWKKS